MVIDSFEEVICLAVFLVLFYFLFKCIFKDFFAAASECISCDSCNERVNTKTKKHKLQRRHRYDDSLSNRKYTNK